MVLFVTQHHRQRCTMMTTDQVIGDFAADFSFSNGSTAVQENECSEHADKEWWGDKVLSNNAK